jgi:hypothetical protein
MLLASSYMLMTCTLTSLLSSPYIAYSQETGAVRTVTPLPREGGMQDTHHAVLVVVHLSPLVTAHLGAEPRHLPVRGKINMQPKMRMK